MHHLQDGSRMANCTNTSTRYWPNESAKRQPFSTKRLDIAHAIFCVAMLGQTSMVKGDGSEQARRRQHLPLLLPPRPPPESVEQRNSLDLIYLKNVDIRILNEDQVTFHQQNAFPFCRRRFKVTKPI